MEYNLSILLFNKEIIMKKGIKILLLIAVSLILVFACVACNTVDAKANYKKLDFIKMKTDLDKIVTTKTEFSLADNESVASREKVIGLKSSDESILAYVVKTYNSETGKYGLYNIQTGEYLLNNEYTSVSLFIDSGNESGGIKTSEYNYFLVTKTEQSSDGSSTSTLYAIYDAYNKIFLTQFSEKNIGTTSGGIIFNPILKNKVVGDTVYNFVIKDGLVYRVGAEGMVQYFGDDNIIYNEDSMKIQFLGEYIVYVFESGTGSKFLFKYYDLSGKFVCDFEIKAESSSSSSSSINRDVFVISNGSIVVRESTRVVYGETKKYDLLINGYPYNIEYTLYNPENKSVKNIDLPYYLISSSTYIGEGYSIISACQVEDSYIDDSQSYLLIVDNKMNVIHNLNNTFVKITDNRYLETQEYGNMAITKSNGSVIKDLGFVYAEPIGKFVRVRNSDMSNKFYDADGNELSTLSNNFSIVNKFEEKLIVTDEISYFTFDIATGTINVIENYSNSYGSLIQTRYESGEGTYEYVYKDINGNELYRQSTPVTNSFIIADNGVYIIEDGKKFVKFE